MKKKLALFLAVVLVATQLGSYIPVMAAQERQVLEPSELKGNIQTASAVEETNFQGVEALKVTPDGTTESVIQFDNWSILNEDISSSDYKYVAVDYYYQVTNPANVLKVSSSDSWPNNAQAIQGYEVGETYVFTCDYYITEGATGSIRFKRNWSSNPADIEKTLQGSGTASLEYKIESELDCFVANVVQHPGGGTGYYWNFRVTKKGSNENLLKNTDFTDTQNWCWGLGSSSEVIPYDDFVKEIEELTKPANVLKVSSSDSWPNNYQEITSSVEEGETYVFTCNYYMTEGSTGSIRFKRSWGDLADIEKTLQGSGTASVEYEVEDGLSWIGVNVVQHPGGGTGYYWNFCVTKKGSDVNLLKNTDFTDTQNWCWGLGSSSTVMSYDDFLSETGYIENDDIVDNKMVVRLLPVQNSNDYRVPENKMVKNQWARVIYDVSDWGTDSSGANYKQMHFFPWGRDGNCWGSNAVGTMYINNISFYKEKPSTPVVTGISFLGNELKAERSGSILIPKVTVEGESYPISAYDLELSGHSSANTRISDGKVYIGADETASQITITAKAVVNAEITDTCVVNVLDAIERTAFDENNITMRFGVVSDVHVSGSWNQKRSVAKFAHMIDTFEKTAQADNATLDALLVNGDLVDAVASAGNVFEINTYGSKAIQNFREVNYVAQGLWGGNSADLTDTTTGYGNGLDDGIKLFYSLGNHDEKGKGEASFSDGTETVYSAEYFAAVICGWQYDISTTRTDYTTATMDNSYVDFINDLIDYNTNPETTTVTANGFYTDYNVTLDSADAKFDKYYGHDLNYSNDNGLLYGNRHMTIGEGNDAIHFVALELSLSQTSLDFLEEICMQSIQENPNKPIFVITHYKVSEGMLGYESVQNQVREVMAQYPQIVAWGGHSHTYLNSDAAIDSDEGFIQVDSGVTAYASQYYLAPGSQYAVNAQDKENHAFGQGCYVEVDKNFNVRIKRIDLYRSYSADYSTDSTLYSVHGMFTNYTEQAAAEPVDTAVFIREPWDITDIGLEGMHLTNYTNERISTTEKPVLTNTSKIDATYSGTEVTADITLDATDDGLVYMYVVELWDRSDGSLVQRNYYTNRFYDYPEDPSQIPELNVTVNITGLTDGTTYELKAYPVDEFNVAGDAISENDKRVEYQYVAEISGYRGTEKTYPSREGYVFAGWYQGQEADAITDDEGLKPIATDTNSGGAWAKYVPEEALSVKAQTTNRIEDNPESTKLRLVSTVDSLRYLEVGFKVKYNQGNKEYTHGTNTVYEKILAIDENDIPFSYSPSEFAEVSNYFVAYTITGIDATLFDNYEFAVLPYWVTLDGTTVGGVLRERLLITDQLANNTDGCDFTVSDSTYTYMTTKSDDNTASYQYFKGASDLVYAEGTYTKADANNQFGISIRNGGEERQIFFTTDGVKVVANDMDTLVFETVPGQTKTANVLKVSSIDNSWPNNAQAISGSEVGETYVFTCDYYITEGATGSIRFKRNWSSNPADIEKTLQGSGTASLEYTLEPDLDCFVANVVQHPGGGTGYYWNFCVTKKGSDVNLLKNTDFTSGGANWVLGSGSEILSYDDFLKETRGVTIYDAEAINTMLSSEAGTETQVAWEIRDNVLYCYLDGVTVYKVPMENLCSDWKDGRYYQVGVAGYNDAATTTEAKFVLERFQVGSNLEIKAERTVLGNTYYRLQKEKELKIAYIGGSITSGFGATDREQYSWRARTTAWFKKTYPDVTVTEINAGIGGTGSTYGAHRAVYDLKLQSESERPDLVFIEFAINDMYDGLQAAEAKLYAESLIRRIYQYAPQADIVFVFTTDLGNGNTCFRTMAAHMEVAEAYQLPYITVGARLWDEIVDENGGQAPTSVDNSVWATYFTDIVHPTDAGYAKYASYVTEYLGEMFSRKETVPSGLADAFYPEQPLTTLLVEPHTADFSGQTFASANITLNTDGSIESSTAGTKFTFTFTGTDVGLMVYGKTTGGDLKVSVDNGESQILSLYRSSDNYMPLSIAQGLEQGTHTVSIELCESAYGSDMKIYDVLISGGALEGVTDVE